MYTDRPNESGHAIRSSRVAPRKKQYLSIYFMALKPEFEAVKVSRHLGAAGVDRIAGGNIYFYESLWTSNRDAKFRYDAWNKDGIFNQSKAQTALSNLQKALVRTDLSNKSKWPFYLIKVVKTNQNQRHIGLSSQSNYLSLYDIHFPVIYSDDPAFLIWPFAPAFLFLLVKLYICQIKGFSNWLWL